MSETDGTAEKDLIPPPIVLKETLTPDDLATYPSYIKFISKVDENGQVKVYFFDLGNHPEALKQNKGLLGMAGKTDSEVTASYYGVDYQDGISGDRYIEHGKEG